MEKDKGPKKRARAWNWKQVPVSYTAHRCERDTHQKAERIKEIRWPCSVVFFRCSAVHILAVSFDFIRTYPGIMFDFQFYCIYELSFCCVCVCSREIDGMDLISTHPSCSTSDSAVVNDVFFSTIAFSLQQCAAQMSFVSYFSSPWSSYFVVAVVQSLQCFSFHTWTNGLWEMCISYRTKQADKIKARKVYSMRYPPAFIFLHMIAG